MARNLVALLAVVFVVFIPSVANGFVLDAAIVAAPVERAGTLQPIVHQVRDLDTYFGTNYWAADAFTADKLYRPLTVLSFAAVNAATFDRARDAAGSPAARNAQSAWAQHTFDVALHTLAAFLVYLLLLRLQLGPAASLAGAAVFGLHALQTEAVVNIVGRADVMSLVFGATGTLWLQRVRSFRSRGFGVGVAVATVWFCAFCCKESAVAWPAFAALFGATRHLLQTPNASWRAALAPSIVRASATAAPGLIAFAVLRSAMAADIQEVSEVTYLANNLAHVDAISRMLTGVKLFGFGLWKYVWPVPLSSDYAAYTFEVVQSPFDIGFLAGALSLCGSLAIGICCARRAPRLALAVFTVLGMSVPTANILFPIGTVFGERLYYATTLGVAILVATGLATRGPRRGYITLAALGLVHVVWIELRIPEWRDESTRVAADLAKCPRNVRLLQRLAIELVSRAHSTRDPSAKAPAVRDALAALQRAYTLDPHLQHSLNNAGLLFLQQGQAQLRLGQQTGDAEVARAGKAAMQHGNALLERALQAPSYRHDSDAQIYANQAAFQEHEGRVDAALQLIRAAIEVDPGMDTLVPMFERVAQRCGLATAEIRDTVTTLRRNARYRDGMRAAWRRENRRAIELLAPIVEELSSEDRSRAVQALSSARARASNE